MKIVLFLFLFLALSGCGVMLGTVVDTAIDIATYPIKEYVFLGSYKYDNTWDTPYAPIAEERDYGQTLVGLAVSGGGSRSAYFMACVLEELSKIPLTDKASYADEIDFISSVSGGSLASAYYCLNRYAPAYRDKPTRFFKNFKEAMAYNFETRALVKYTFGGEGFLDMFTYYDRGDIMANIWEEKQFLGKSTFADLAKAQKQGAPVLLINGTNLNDGLKFVFTTMEDKALNASDYFAHLRNACFIKHAAAAVCVPFQTIGFQSINSDIQPYWVSKAVVASASVPNLLGPVTLKDYTQEDRLVHIVDGGVYDNYGLETLMQVMTAVLDQYPGRPAKILIVDGSGYFPEQSQHSDKFSVAYYSERPLAISWLRTKSYMEYVFQKAREFENRQKVRPYRNLEYELFSLYDVLPSQQKKSSAVKDPALQKILRPDVATLEFLQKLTSIQTRFKVSRDDARMIEQMAVKVTQRLTNPKE